MWLLYKNGQVLEVWWPGFQRRKKKAPQQSEKKTWDVHIPLSLPQMNFKSIQWGDFIKTDQMPPCHKNQKH